MKGLLTKLWLDRNVREKDDEGGQLKRPKINRTSRYALEDAMQKSLDSSRQDARAEKGGGRPRKDEKD